MLKVFLMFCIQCSLGVPCDLRGYKYKEGDPDDSSIICYFFQLKNTKTTVMLSIDS